MIDLVTLYNGLTGIIAGGGILYLLSEQEISNEHHRFVSVLLSGILLYVTVSPVVNSIAPHLTHLIHIFAGLLVIWGLYSPLHNDLRTDQWNRLLFRDPGVARRPDEWMTPMDDEILQLFHSTHLILSPSIIAENIDYSRDEINRRLRILEDHEYVSRSGRGRYQLTTFGEKYIRGTAVETFWAQSKNNIDKSDVQ